MKRAVVTGGAGFLGSHLCDQLLAEHFEVICVDNFLTSELSNIAYLLADPGFTLLNQDITSSFRIAGPVDLVLHFASPASPVDYLKLPIETLRVGSEGTLRALELARDKDARFILASTSEVYGDPLQHPQVETYWGNVNPVGPRGVYDEAKRYAESLTTAFRSTFGVRTGIVRIFNTFGERMRPEDGRAVPTFIRQALSGRPITVAGDGSQTRSIQYVSDLVRGVLLMAASDHPGPVNIGNPHELSVLDIARLVIDVVGQGPPVITFTALPVDDPSRRRPDITAAHDLLGWQPTVDIRLGLAHTVGWFRKHFYPARQA